MIKKLLLLIPALTQFLFGCNQTEIKKKKEINISTVKVDTTLLAIIPYDSTQHRLLQGNKPAMLTNEDLKRIEIILINCINDYNRHRRPYNGSSEAAAQKLYLPIYKRQYIASFNTKGEKEIWVNCFCNSVEVDWKRTLVIVQDGGNCFFNLLINLTTGHCDHLIVNGLALQRV
jgi:hypothetical protein